MENLCDTERLNVEKYMKVVLPADPDTIREMTWAELHEMRGSLRKASSELLQRCKTAGREPTEAEDSAFEASLNFLEAVNDEFTERSTSGRREPAGDDVPYRVSCKSGGTEETANGLPGSEYRRVLFGGGRTLDNGGFRDANDFYETILLKPNDQRSVSTVSGVLGGFAVPDLYAQQIFSTIAEESFAFPRCTLYRIENDTPGQEFHIPCWSSENHADGPMASVKAAFVGELISATEEEAAMRLVTLNLKKAAVYLSASREAISDGLGIASQISKIMATAIGTHADEQVVRGTGIAAPVGILTSPSKVNVDRAGAGTITTADVFGMYCRMYPSCIKNSVWLASPSALYSLMTLQDPGNHYLWVPGEVGNISGDVPGFLLGRPIIVTEHCSELGNEGDIILVDLSQIALVTKGSIIIESSNSAKWSQDAICFRALLRYDLKTLWSSAITPANGTTTLSWAAVLE